MKTRHRWTVVTALLLAFSGAAFAQGNGNGTGRNKLPNGKPFQMLANAIKNLDAKLQQQIASLQAQLDANAAADAVRQQMIDSLFVAAQQMEIKLAAVKATAEQLQAYNEVQDARLAFQQAQIAVLAAELGALQGQVAAQGNALLGAIVSLHNAQQDAINTLNGQVAVLQFQATVFGNTIVQQAQILATLNGQLASLASQYAATRVLLANGCPAGSSIRALGLGGEMACQPDTGTPSGAQIVEAAVVPPGGVAGHSAFCPANMFAIGGGVSFPGAIGLLGVNAPAGFGGWQAIVANPTAAPLQFVVTVNCLRVS